MAKAFLGMSFFMSGSEGLYFAFNILLIKPLEPVTVYYCTQQLLKKEKRIT